jgi:hypothetical protein
MPYLQVPVCMSYDGDALHVRRASLAAPLHLVLVDLRAAKDTVAILRGLQVCHCTCGACVGLRAANATLPHR